MVNALEAARKAARRALEGTYEGTCTIYEYRDVEDEKTGLAIQEEAAAVEGQPCRLSFEKLSPAVQTETAAALAQGVKLFLAPEVPVKAGSKITVIQNGAAGEYAAAGLPAVYPTHQEVVLELAEKRV